MSKKFRFAYSDQTIIVAHQRQEFTSHQVTKQLGEPVLVVRLQILCIHILRVPCHIHDEGQIVRGNLRKVTSGYPHLCIMRIDGILQLFIHHTRLYGRNVDIIFPFRDISKIYEDRMFRALIVECLYAIVVRYLSERFATDESFLRTIVCHDAIAPKSDEESEHLLIVLDLKSFLAIREQSDATISYRWPLSGLERFIDGKIPYLLWHSLGHVNPW